MGNNQYEITLKVYRDCINGLAPFDNPAYLTVFDGANLAIPFQNLSLFDVDSITIPPTINNPCLQIPPNICVREATYTYITTLPPNNDGYYIAYQRCCRNNSIINLINPGDQGSTYMCFIPPSSLATCNSSPRYSEFPPIALCAGEDLVFNHAATDPDGDVLVYSLCDAYSGANTTDPYPVTTSSPQFATVNYSGGYNAGYPIASNPAIQIDPNTGILTATPSQIGQYVVAVCVNEYRNGQLLSTNKRDFQFNVVNCTSNILAAIPGQTSTCLGRNVAFSNNSVNSSFYHWDFGVTNIDYDTSNLETPTFQYADTGIYTITLIANPGWPCADTASVDYVVNELLEADIPALASQCFNGNSFDFSASGIFQSYSTFAWEFGNNANPQTSTVPNPQQIVFNTADTFLVKLTIESDGCFSNDSINVITYNNPEALFTPIYQTGCAPFLVQFSDSSTYNFALTHNWSFGDTKTSNLQNPFNIYENPGSYDVSLQVISTFGCLDTSVFTIPNLITVLPSPNALISVDTSIRSEFEPTFTFQNQSTGATDCRLEFPDGTGADTCDLQYTFEGDTGQLYIKQIVVNEKGCPDVFYLPIYIQREYLLYIPNSFTPNGDGRNDVFFPVGMGVKQYQIDIFNRWGEQIFRSKNFNEGWDGTYRGQNDEPCQSAVYAYKIYVRGVDLETRLFSGKVTLVR